MITKSHVVGIAMCIGASSSMANACTSTKSLGGLGPPDVALFGNSFKKAGSYVDCFSFTLAGAATAIGGVVEYDPPFNKLDIDVKSVALYSNSSATAVQTDWSPLDFSFGGLIGGMVYTLQVISTVSKDSGPFGLEVGYGGKIVTLAAAVPEPAAYALALVGLTVVGVGMLRARKR